MGTRQAVDVTPTTMSVHTDLAFAEASLRERGGERLHRAPLATVTLHCVRAELVLIRSTDDGVEEDVAREGCFR